MFETASFHIIRPCNMKCKFCYARFEDFYIRNQLSVPLCIDILRKLKEAGLQKITFAGGEPMLFKNLAKVIRYSKAIGLTTSIITNGSMLTEGWLSEMKDALDWVGISIDSLDLEVNNKAGRKSKDEYFGLGRYLHIVSQIKKYDYKLKINTVVHAYNKDEDMNNFITVASPDRWKVFQALRVEGQNDSEFDEIKVSHQEYMRYIHRHSKQPALVAEDNELMTGSYLLIDPLGRLFENSAGKHTYSEPLQNSTVKECLKQINLNRETFIDRGGIYNW